MPRQSEHRQRLRIGNRQARRIWLAANGLSGAGDGPVDVLQTIRDLGFLQIDTVRNVTRAHHHILWSRNTGYREDMLWPLLRQRALFEHFTHDASLLPMEVYPMWQRQFERLGRRTANAAWYQSGLTQGDIRKIRDRIKAEGPLSTHAFESLPRSGEMWSRPPHKKALEQMWYAGDLATSHRENFVKFYDLGERVFPALNEGRASLQEQADYLCDAAMTRLGIANASEIRTFWDAVTPSEVSGWIAGAGLVPVSVEDAEGRWHDTWAVPDIEKWFEDPGTAARMRIINPFDPAIRDRQRLLRVSSASSTGTRCSFRGHSGAGAIMSTRFWKQTGLSAGSN